MYIPCALVLFCTSEIIYISFSDQIQNMDKKKKRKDMTPGELAQIRKADRERQQRRRIKLDEQEKEKIRIKDRESRAKVMEKMTEKEKEKKRVIKVIRMRKYCLMETEEKRKLAQNKAKEGMRILRKEGPIRNYIERNKRHAWAVKWKKFLSQNPEFQELEKKKKLKK